MLRYRSSTLTSKYLVAHPHTHRHNAHTHTCVLVHLLRTTVVREYLQPLTQGQILSFNRTVRCSALTTCDFRSKACLTVGISPTLQSLHSLQEHGYALATANAGTANGPFGTPPVHLMHEVGSDAGARGTCVAENSTHTQSQHTPG